MPPSLGIFQQSALVRRFPTLRTSKCEGEMAAGGNTLENDKWQKPRKELGPLHSCVSHKHYLTQTFVNAMLHAKLTIDYDQKFLKLLFMFDVRKTRNHWWLSSFIIADGCRRPKADDGELCHLLTNKTRHDRDSHKSKLDEEKYTRSIRTNMDDQIWEILHSSHKQE